MNKLSRKNKADMDHFKEKHKINIKKHNKDLKLKCIMFLTKKLISSNDVKRMQLIGSTDAYACGTSND